MKFNDTVRLVKKTPGKYNSTTGKNEGSTSIEEVRSCSISKMSRERRAKEYGSVDVKVNILIFQTPLEEFYTECYLNGNKKPSKILEDSNFKKGALFVEGG